MRFCCNAINHLVPVISILLVTHANGQIVIRPVTLSGEYAPGTGEDAIFSSGAGPIFGAPMINNRGEIAFWARTLTISAPQSTGYGIWMGQPGSLSLVARTGDPAPGLPLGTAFLNIWDNYGIRVQLNDQGEVAFFSELTGSAVGGTIREYGIWTGSSENLGLVVRHGDPALQAGLDLEFRLGSTSVLPPPFFVLNDRCEIAAQLWHMASDGTFLNSNGVWSGSAIPLSQAGLTNTRAPGTPEGVYFDYFSAISLSVNSVGEVAFVGRLRGTGIDCCNSNNQGVWMGRPGQIELVARGSEQAEGVSSGVQYGLIREYDRIAINDSGEVAFRAELVGGPAYDKGIWVGTPGNLRLLARSNSDAPGFPGGSFAAFESPSLSTNGLVAFGALVDTGGSMGLVDSIYVGRPGHLNLVVCEGMQVPDMQQGVVFSNIAPGVIPVNRHGQVVFEAWLQGPGISSNNAETLWVGSRHGSLSLIIQTGEALEIAPGDHRVFHELEVLDTLGGEDGRSRCLNDAGHLAFRVKTGPVGDGAILTAQVPISGDCDGDGDVDLVDYSGLEECLLGPTGGLGGFACGCFDLDASGSVDLRDYADLQVIFTGD